MTGTITLQKKHTSLENTKLNKRKSHLTSKHYYFKHFLMFKFMSEYKCGDNRHTILTDNRQ